MKSLGLTDLFILGLLKQKPMYGYEIKQLVEKGHTEDWAKITQSSIYHSLRKLEKKGLVTKTCHQDGHLEQRIYQLTEEGLTTFHRLVEDCLARTDDLYPEYGIALMFQEEIEKEALIKAVQKRREFLLARIAYTEDCLTTPSAKEGITRYWPGEKRVVGGHNLHFYKSELAWLEDFLKELQE